ncbi:MAG: radical SAM family heme chaperone HemW [Alphaproteobacteria bacterium]|nr:radical SAM family heme chaperone HemW [Alphaproteobacteria bacterium]
MKSKTNTPIGLYIHWPYCLSKCPYCAFASSVPTQIDEDALLKGYFRDLDSFLTNRPISTIFFGGGTPSLMTSAFLEKIMAHIREKGTILSDAEITMEANPDAIDLPKMIAFHDLGVNRLSLGVQSLKDSDLEFLGRRHTVQTALKRIDEARKVFNNINIDLIYARPDQNLYEWENELRSALSLGLPHYSLYQLSIEKHTPFSVRGIQPAPENIAAGLYRLSERITSYKGYVAYEISNYAKPGFECRHNLGYWRGLDYIGVGPAAHGRIGMTATQNPRGVNEWLQKGTLSETLTPKEKKTERLLMGLRLRQEWYPVADLSKKKIIKLVSQNLLEQSPQGIRPTLSGALVLNQIILELMD